MGVAAPVTAHAPGFGELLRGWRQRRRLSQLNLAGRAEVSSRHLSFIETGRARPSREMVLHLAEALDVPLRERNGLLVAAGFAPVYAASPLDEARMTPVRDALEMVLAAHDPYPAVVVDGTWNLVSANPAAFRLTDQVAPELLEPPLNVVRISVHPRGLAPHIVNFGQYAGHLLGRLRRQAERTADPALIELLAEAVEYCGASVTEAIPAPDDVVLPLRLRVADTELSLFSTISVFGAPRDVTIDELAIEMFYPADDATASALRTRT